MLLMSRLKTLCLTQSLEDSCPRSFIIVVLRWRSMFCFELNSTHGRDTGLSSFYFILFFVYKRLIVTIPCSKGPRFILLDSCVIFIQNHLTVNVRVYFWSLSVPRTSTLILAPTAWCLGWCKYSNLVFLAQNCLRYSRSFASARTF